MKKNSLSQFGVFIGVLSLLIAVAQLLGSAPIEVLIKALLMVQVVTLLALGLLVIDAAFDKPPDRRK